MNSLFENITIEITFPKQPIVKNMLNVLIVHLIFPNFYTVASDSCSRANEEAPSGVDEIDSLVVSHNRYCSQILASCRGIST